MVAVIFELQAADGQRDTYLALAAEVVRDYGLERREQAPQDSRGYHRT
ncbi:TPA: hypothetical protein ACQVHI_001286 [Serratia marcescens]